MNYAKDRPLVSATAFHVPYTALDDGSAVYGTVVNAGAAKWVLGATLKARAIDVTVFNGALTGAPTGLLVGLYKGTDSSGTAGAVVPGTTTEWLTPAASTYRFAEIDLSKITIDPAAYYSLGLSLNGAGTTALSAAAIGRFIDPVFAS